MKKFKKIAALLLAMVMVIAMAVPAFADTTTPTATVTIENVDAKATVKYYQIIEPDQTKESGWDFVSEEVAKAFVNGFNGTTDQNVSDEDAQNVIWSMILKIAGTTVTGAPDDVTAATASQIEAGMAAVRSYANGSTGSTAALSGSNASFNVTEAGVYVIDIVSTNKKYTYNVMAQYVEFGYNTDGSAAGVIDEKVYEANAKSSSTPFEKSVADGDKVVYIGGAVQYTISTVIPYWTDAEQTNASYTITDELTGGKYVGTTNGKVDVTYKIGSENAVETTCDITTADGKSTFTLNLTSVLDIANNKYANQTLTVTYNVEITGETTSNTATPKKNGTNLPGDTEEVYTGSITMTKYDDGAGNNAKALAGAKFKVYYETTNGTTTVKNYAKVAKDGTVTNGHEYVVTGWTTTESEATEMETYTNGTFVIRGLDKDVTYMFQETQAPEGYSLNAADAEATWNAVSGTISANTQITGSANMSDTKLSALPSTGGIGTTIFTIAGCIIMIAAGGMLIVSRRKKNA